MKIFAVNPGSTSTKIALYENGNLLIRSIEHPSERLLEMPELQDQFDYRKNEIEKVLADTSLTLEGVDAFVGRAGSVSSVTGGTYLVNDLMLDHARNGNPYNQIKHPAMLGPQFVRFFSGKYGGMPLVVNPPDVDEFDEVARITGLKGIYRKSSIHALNQKEVALRYAKEKGIRYEELNLIICHIGGGISVTAHRKGRMVDSNDIARGDGPMAPTRTGMLPAAPLIELCMSGRYTQTELQRLVIRGGGLVNHLGTSDARQVRRRMEAGDPYAKLVYDAMIYQIAKEAGSRAVALYGKIDGIILTGGIANDGYLVEKLRQYLEWLAPVTVMAGEFEMEALVNGALRVLCHEEPAKEYSGVPVWLKPTGWEE